MTTPGFAQVFEKLRKGDQHAAAETVRQLEPYLLIAIRLRLGRRLRNLFDSRDIYQSVLCDFFQRTLSNQALGSLDQVCKLLVKMIQDKVIDKWREHRREHGDCQLEGDVESAAPTPVQMAVERDLVRTILGRFDAKERAVAQLRLEGYHWNEIAERMEGDADALRMRLTRAFARVRREMED